MTSVDATQRVDPWLDPASMPAVAWGEITSAHEDMMRSIEIAFAERPRSSIAAAMPRAANAIPDLEGLRAALDVRLDQLQMRLGATIGGPIAKACVKPLSYFFNEQVEIRLTSIAGGEDWPQPEETELGGEAFYADVATVLALGRQQISPMVVGVYLFCLRAGFKGRYWDNPTKIADLASALTKKLTYEEPALGLARSKAVASAPSLARMLAIAGGALVGYQIVLLAISRAM